MYEFERGKSIKGVILNKVIPPDVKLGGPVGLTNDMATSEKIVLHNIPGAKNSVEIIDGVYWFQGHMKYLQQYKEQKSKLQSKTKYKNKIRYQINEYYGFASWFDGQLDGEIESGGWTIRNDVVAEEVFGKNE